MQKYIFGTLSLSLSQVHSVPEELPLLAAEKDVSAVVAVGDCSSSKQMKNSYDHYFNILRTLLPTITWAAWPCFREHSGNTSDWLKHTESYF